MSWLSRLFRRKKPEPVVAIPLRDEAHMTHYTIAGLGAVYDVPPADPPRRVGEQPTESTIPRHLADRLHRQEPGRVTVSVKRRDDAGDDRAAFAATAAIAGSFGVAAMFGGSTSSDSGSSSSSDSDFSGSGGDFGGGGASGSWGDDT